MQAQAEHDRRDLPTPRGGGAPQTLRVWLLGGFRVSVGSRSIGEQEWHLRKSGSPLKVLALAEGHRLNREQVIALLCPDSPLWVDAEAFEQTAASARHAPLESEAFRAAIELYSGELLPEDRYEPWVEGLFTGVPS
jgi:DNA-binding SARP family transcriptional activator